MVDYPHLEYCSTSCSSSRISVIRSIIDGRCRVLFTPGNLDIISTGLCIWHSCVRLRWQLEEFLHFLRECGFGAERNFPNMFSYSALCLVRRQ